MGRPTKLSPSVQRRICDAISAGNYREAAAQYGGIDGATFRRWMATDREPYRTFSAAVIAAEAEAEVRMVAQWQAQIPEDWRAARDFLARRHPDRWGPLERREVTGSIEVTEGTTTPAALIMGRIDELAAKREERRLIDAESSTG